MVLALPDTGAGRTLVSRGRDEGYQDLEVAEGQKERVDMSDEVLKTHLEEGIAEAVLFLRAHGVETMWSCEGGPGHACPEPTIRFDAQLAEAFEAYAICERFNWPLHSLRCVWDIGFMGEPCGPVWELVFTPPVERGRRPGC